VAADKAYQWVHLCLINLLRMNSVVTIYGARADDLGLTCIDTRGLCRQTTCYILIDISSIHDSFVLWVSES
jgi:hypothetical protein